MDGDRKSPVATPREHRGIRLTIAVIGTLIPWGWSLAWASGRTFPSAASFGARLWQFSPFLVGTGISLFCLGWASTLLWEGVSSPETADGSNAAQLVTGGEAKSGGRMWTAGEELKALAVFFVAGMVLNWAIGFASGNIFPVFGRGIFLASGAALWIASTGVLFYVLRVKAPEGRWRKVGAILFATPIIVLVMSAMLSDTTAAGQRSPLYWGLRIALVAAIAFVPLALVAGLVPIWLVSRGKFEWALRLNRLLFWTPGTNNSNEGWILVMAGRYEEARAYLKPLAFNAKGHPLLTSQEFYLYALALSIAGDYAAAEMLFDAAISVPQTQGNFHFGLAECLLTQQKDSSRARTLVETVLAGYPVNPRTNLQRANRAQILAFHAWALASDGWTQEAELRLEKAFACSDGIDKCSLAAMHLPVGHTWLALGDRGRARTCFQEALTLFPFGDIAIRARKNLAELESR
jgi:tetratricopeptide (TPR) repeat protein